MSDLLPRLQVLADPSYKSFLAPLVPDLDPETILGVRAPALRRLAAELRGTAQGEAFLSQLPHRYLEQNNLHAYLLCKERSYQRALALTQAFLPYVNNWATCDALRPAVFTRHRTELLPWIKQWLDSPMPYTCRFGLGMLMTHYLDGDFFPQVLDWAAAVRREEYYVRMMQAWYFATALAKQYQATLPYLEQDRLPRWVHNKTIQKAVESFRIPEEHKQVLRGLRRKG